MVALSSALVGLGLLLWEFPGNAAVVDPEMWLLGDPTDAAQVKDGGSNWAYNTFTTLVPKAA